METETQSQTGPTLIRLVGIGRRSLARDLKLRADDVIVAINGAQPELDMDQFELLMKTGAEEELLLTIYRKGQFFDILANGSLGSNYEFAKPELVEEIMEKLPEHQFKEHSDYRQFEAMRNINRHVCIVDTEYSVFAVSLPAFWLLNQRMWAPLGVVLATYGVSYVVHPTLFMLVYILLSIYFHKAHIQLVRGYFLYTEHYYWMKFAATSDKHAQEICRRFDPRCRFDFSHVGEPEKKPASPLAAGA